MGLSRTRTNSGTLPYYKKRGHVASTYLLQSRRELLSTLPVRHPMQERTSPSGILRPIRMPVVSRPPFTDAEIRDIKRRRNEVASDPDNASSHLQRSQLINMWNADCDQQEQWEEYDQAQPIMEERRDHSGLPDEVFESRDVVGEKRKRLVSSGHDKPPRVRLLNDDDDVVSDAGDLEEGEVVDESTVHKIEEMNQYLQEQNEALRQMIEMGVNGSPPEAPASPPDSETSEQLSDTEEAVHLGVDELPDAPAEAQQADLALAEIPLMMSSEPFLPSLSGTGQQQ